MDFTLTEDQQLIRETARKLLDKECPSTLVREHITDPAAYAPLWEHLRGFSALGSGPAPDLCLFLEQTGYVIAPGPFFATTALFAPLLHAIGHPSAESVADGSVTGTVAMAGADGAWLPNTDATKTFVLEADRVDQLAIVLPGPAVAVVERPDAARMRFVETVDFSRRVFEIDTSGLIDGARPVTTEVIDAWRDRTHVSFAAEMVGTARRIFDMSLQYAKERKQFDVPIGSFQAIQHKLAEMSLALERANAAVHYAAMTVDAADAERAKACHVAAAAAGEAARRMLKDGIQIHGGIGYTWEHDLQMFLRRATADEGLFGTTGWHHDQLADLIID